MKEYAILKSSNVKTEPLYTDWKHENMKCYEYMVVITIKPDWDAKWLFTIFIWIHFSSAMIVLKSFEENNFI